MSEIFISYAREDRARIQPLAEYLERHGWTVFWDRKIQAGQQWHDVISAALDAASRVIVAWSEASLSSDFVRDEAASAQARRILVPILLDPVTPPLGFRQIQTADFADWHGEEHAPALEQLLAVLGSPPARHGSSVPAATLPAVSVARTKTRALPVMPVAIGGGFLLVVGVATTLILSGGGPGPSEADAKTHPSASAETPVSAAATAGPSVTATASGAATAVPSVPPGPRPWKPPSPHDIASRFKVCNGPGKSANVAARQEQQADLAKFDEMRAAAERKAMLATLDAYYEGVNESTFDAEQYFAPRVRVYISIENTTPKALNRYFKVDHPALYGDYQVKMDEASITTKSPRVLSFCEVSRFVERRTQLSREVSALNVVAFDEQQKIVSFGTTMLGESTSR